MKKSYIIFFISVLFLNFTTSDLKSSIFKVNDVEISQPFELNFKKENVTDKAFREAFKRLTRMTIVSNEISKIGKIKNNEIKNLIDSFIIKDEKFIKNSYIANFDVNFNKQNTLLFFEKRNIFPSLPDKKRIFLLPVLIDVDKKTINIFNDNPIFDNWKISNNNYFLLDYTLPTENIDLIKVLNDNIDNLENYEFKRFVKNYNTNDFIICLIYKYKNKIKIFSKVNINNEQKIESIFLENSNLKDEKNINNLILSIKELYENHWKKINQINRSVKLALNISVISSEHEKNSKFEKFLIETEFVSHYFIKDFNNQKINYKIIFNGSPNKFLELCNKFGLSIDTSKQVWLLK